VCASLEPEDIARLASTCRALRHLGTADCLWAQQAQQRFGVSLAPAPVVPEGAAGADDCATDAPEEGAPRPRAVSAPEASTSGYSGPTSDSVMRARALSAPAPPRSRRACLEAFKALHAGRRAMRRASVSQPAPAGVASPAPFLRWRGVSTDGGVDNDDRRYWVDKMFCPSEWDSYCSVRPMDVHCMGELEDGLAEVDQHAADRRAFMMERLRIPVRVVYGAAPADGAGGIGEMAESLDTWSMAEMETMLLELWEGYQAGFPFGQLLFQGLHGSRRAAEIERVARIAEEILEARAVPSVELRYDAADHNAVSVPRAPLARCGGPADGIAQGSNDTPQLLAMADQLVVSRKGQFSCPVKAGAVFMTTCGSGASAQTPSSAPACAALKGLATLTGVLAATRAKDSPLPAVAATHHLPYGDVVEFQPPRAHRRRAGELYPVAWFCFTDKRLGPRRGSPRGAPRDLLEVRLSSVHVGTTLCVKLIASENLMDLYNDNHDSPNIDVTFVGLGGACVHLPPASDLCVR